MFLLLMAAMASSTAPLPAVALLSRSQEGSHTPEWTVLCCQTPHCLMLLVVTYILFYILAALPKVVDEKDGSFPSPWGNLPGPYIHFSFEYIVVSSMEQNTSSCPVAVQSHVRVHFFTAAIHQDPSVMDKH